MLKKTFAYSAAMVGTAVSLSVPVYAQEDKRPKAAAVYDCPLPHNPSDLKQPTELERIIQRSRKELAPVMDNLMDYKTKFMAAVEDVRCKTQSNIIYLRTRAPNEARYGVIATGGLLGLLMATRRSYFKKILYTSMGAGAAASVIYPRAAKAYAMLSLCTAIKYSNIAYNFVTGSEAKGSP